MLHYELSELKRSRSLLLSVFGLDEKKKKWLCPLHSEKTESFNIFEQNGVWFFKCFGCGVSGDIIKAVQLFYKTDFKGAVAHLQKESGIPLKVDDTERPVLRPSAVPFVEKAHQTLMDRFDLQEDYLVGKRNLSLDIAQKYKLGFVENHLFFGKWKVSAWVIPIYDGDHLCAVRMHCEKRNDHKIPKCFWAPYGMQKPHGYSTWYPLEVPPEGSEIVVSAGELKALANRDIGLTAFAPTCGEGSVKAGMMQRLLRCKPSKIWIDFDNDPTGLAYKERLSAFCTENDIAVGFLDYSKSTEQKPKVEPKICLPVQKTQTKVTTLDVEYFEPIRVWCSRQMFSFVKYQWQNAIELLYSGNYGQLTGKDLEIAIEFVERLKATYGKWGGK